MVMVPFLAGRDCFFLTSKPGRPSRPAFFALRGTPASRPRCIGGDERSAPRLPLLKPLVAHKRESNWPRPTVAPIGPGLDSGGELSMAEIIKHAWALGVNP